VTWLRRIRKERGLSQIQVALNANIAQPTYCNIENGLRHPSPAVAKKIASILGFDWTLFFEDSENAS
jgi:transcriptional regulator with XRE-family HTH domain